VADNLGIVAVRPPIEGMFYSVHALIVKLAEG
jgi:hypothetical protein